MSSAFRIFIFLFAFIFLNVLPGCSYKHHDPVANFQISVPTTDQRKFVNTVKEFAKKSGFSVVEGHIDREGRIADQFVLSREDGVQINVDNFLQADKFSVLFYALSTNAKWQDSEKDFISLMNQDFGEVKNKNK